MRNLLLTLAVALGPSAAAAADPDPKGVEFFESKIRPVLAEHCYGCHSADAEKARKLKAGLRLDTADAMRQGGDSGPAMVPGKPGESLLVKALKGVDLSQMPPKGKLPAAVIADFERWVEIGAPDPRAGDVREAPAVDVERGRKHWAFQPPRKVEPPAVRDVARAETDLDRFVLAKLDEKGLAPNRPADKRTLVRRVYFDLVGLPPTPAEVDAFVNDPSPDAYAKLVDRLLASPHHGERWARHWLDVARYSEDQAHTFEVKPKANAWRYRDWVVKALNDDMPYDQFVRLQLAGDLVPESAGDPFTRLAGLGLLGLGAVYYKGSPTALADELDDKVDTVTRGFLGLTVACARCHDHKYDPVPQRDYYSLAGVFNGCQLVEAPLAPADVARRYDEAQARIKALETRIRVRATLEDPVAAEAVRNADRYVVAGWKVKALRAAGKDVPVADVAASEKLDRKLLDRWAKYLGGNASRVTPALKGVAAAKPPKDAGKTYADLAVPDEVADLARKFRTTLQEASDAESPSKEQVELLTAVYGEKNGPLFTDPAEVEKRLAKPGTTFAKWKAELERLKKESPPAPPVAHVIKGGGQEMRVYVRGNPARPGEVAPKGFLQVLAPAAAKHPKDYGRLELADAIASPANPLTARVIVNRVWAQHLGRGLVATPSNFGVLGDRPSHPELLDWLAVRFVENGWSLKWLHREILLSATYRRSSEANPANEADADNVYLWRANRRRLEVEPWRDALLAVSGRLDPALGGPTTDLKDPANTRRTVYAKISRHELDGLLRLFDFPDANVTADRRTQTTVPQQQLFVLNSEFMVAQAKAFAARVRAGAETDADRVALAYRLAYGRPPTDAEAEVGLAFLSVPATSDDRLTKWEQYAQALLAANEFLYID